MTRCLLIFKTFEKKQQDRHTNEADLQNLKLKGSGPFTLKNNFEQNTVEFVYNEVQGTLDLSSL
jgi:hypothetical protein